jgi:hypothetical protein
VATDRTLSQERDRTFWQQQRTDVQNAQVSLRRQLRQIDRMRLAAQACNGRPLDDSYPPQDSRVQACISTVSVGYYEALDDTDSAVARVGSPNISALADRINDLGTDISYARTWHDVAVHHMEMVGLFGQVSRVCEARLRELDKGAGLSAS